MEHDPHSGERATTGLRPDDRVLMLKIGSAVQQAAGDPHRLYELARSWWAASPAQVQTVRLVLGVAGNEVVAAWTPVAWDVSVSPDTAGKVAFRGTPAIDAESWLGMSVAHLYPKGAANPVRYTTVAALAGSAPLSSPGVSPAPVGATPEWLLLRISKSWREDITPEELYEATRGNWTMSMAKADNITRAFAVAHGVVREVYEPFAWFSSPVPGEENRVGFDGRVASDRDRWVGRDVSAVFPHGSQNPVRYVFPADLQTLDADGDALNEGPAAAHRPEMGRGSGPDFTERVDPLLDALESDLLWSMSRAAQELFHSNTLSWLLSEHPGAAAPLAAVFDAGGEGPIDVWREWRHIDLVAQRAAGRGRFVVENKLYSIPYAEQLVRYLEAELPWSTGHGAGGAPDTAYLLLTLMDPNFKLPAPWRRVSYEQVLAALDAIRPDELGRDADLVVRYRALVRRLVELKAAADPRENPDEPFSVKAALARLGRNGFVGPLQRMRFTGLAQMVADEYGAPIPLDVDITRAMGLITYERELSDTRSIGWQLQESQLRLFVLVKDPETHGPGAEKAEARARVAEAEFGGYVAFDAAEQVLGDLLLPKDFPPGVWQKFAPDFVYRYWKVDDGATTRQVAEALSELTAYVDSWGRP